MSVFGAGDERIQRLEPMYEPSFHQPRQNPINALGRSKPVPLERRYQIVRSERLSVRPQVLQDRLIACRQLVSFAAAASHGLHTAQ